jgi:hypothetical protein
MTIPTYLYFFMMMMVVVVVVAATAVEVMVVTIMKAVMTSSQLWDITATMKSRQ